MKNSIIHRYFLLAILLATLSIQSCVKDSNSFVVTNPGTSFKGNIKNIYINAEKDVIPESFVINSNVENLVTTSNGMRVSIPSSSFLTFDKKPVTGDVSLSIYLLTKKSDWVRFAQFSNNSNYLIDWYKTLSVEATANGIPLILKEGKSLTLQLPEDNPSVNWKLFNGEYQNSRTFLTTVSPIGYNYKTWKNDQGKEIKGLEFPLTDLNWIGIGTIINNPPQNGILVNLPNNFRQFNTAVIATNPLDNVIYYLNITSTSSSSYRGYLHTLKDITLLVLSEQGDNTYFGSKDYFQELSPDAVIDKEPSLKSQLEIEEYINAL